MAVHTCGGWAIMFGLSRLGLKTLIVACAIASVAFPQAGFAQQPATPPVTKTTVTTAPVVFAAASMETALDAIAASWTAQSGRSPSIVYASSAALAASSSRSSPASTSPVRRAMARLQSASSNPAQAASTPSRRWRSSASGRKSNRSWRRSTMSAPR